MDHPCPDCGGENTQRWESADFFFNDRWHYCYVCNGCGRQWYVID